MPTRIRLSLLQYRNFHNRKNCFLRCGRIIQDLWVKVISLGSALSMNAQTPRWKQPKVSWQFLDPTLILCAPT
uniref:Uncharacterized protein n=1 Tax=Aegilops tauschii subsp. strangulata TaxID=200361 RepID=A0A453PRY5_AEGTS